MTTATKDQRRHCATLLFRMTPDEKDRFQDAAWRSRKSLTEWIRDACETAIQEMK